ncbi:MAG: hypothetical protein HY680_00960 [Chloroflexi bacterium]|nr:hypothetical protein [Chloroflexota bacterium]
MKRNTTANPTTRRIGRVLILAGVAVWLPFFALEIAGSDPNVAYFLPFHLSGVIPGAVLSRWGQIKRLLVRRSANL